MHLRKQNGFINSFTQIAVTEPDEEEELFAYDYHFFSLKKKSSLELWISDFVEGKMASFLFFASEATQSQHGRIKNPDYEVEMHLICYSG